MSTLGSNQSLGCEKVLQQSALNSTCIDAGSRKVCCCSPAVEHCNSQWKPRTHLPHLNGKEASLFIGSIVLIFLIFYCLNRFLRFATAEWGYGISSEGGDKLTSIELNCGVAKLIIGFILLMGLWYPVLPECQDHLEGVFEPRYVFIAQLVVPYVIGLFFCVYPLLMLLVDANRMRFMGMRFFVCRPAHSSVSTTVALVAIIPLSLFLIKCSDLYRHEMEMNYCKLRKQWIRIGLVCALYVLYVLFTLAQEIGLLVLLRDITPYEENIIKSPDRIKSFKESPRELLETAKANTVVEKSDALQVTPRPFIIDSNGEGVLSVENTGDSDWITISVFFLLNTPNFMVLISAPLAYTIYPQKLIVPPRRSATISVHFRNNVDMSSTRGAGLMLQWYTLGASCPMTDVTRLWQRPYLTPRSFWKFYVLPIYHESQETITNRESRSVTAD